ncbi:hypothetical protein RF11_04330 [Thelohanellus kitauei]|uniref:Formyl transferase C-terminal domain-containing protein n=1 Tax=Thelohanellus kitauei TaxID=669202 RepID=A0A0C2N3H2_THEKT|nr:hypothetical protein RF11_04330 [Thelohanellus kitauei]
MDVLEKYDLYQSMAFEQNGPGTYASKLKRSELFIDWKNETSVQICRKFMAFYPKYRLRTFYRNHEIILNQIQPFNGLYLKPLNKNGQLFYSWHHNAIIVKCCDGIPICVKSLQFATRPSISAESFYHGYLNKFPNEIFETDS